LFVIPEGELRFAREPLVTPDPASFKKAKGRNSGFALLLVKRGSAGYPFRRKPYLTLRQQANLVRDKNFFQEEAR
jgi:hypothetical protein